MNAVQWREKVNGAARKTIRSRAAARSAVEKLRRRYFAASCEPGARRGISFDDLLIHLWRSRRYGSRLRLQAVIHLEDIALAIACIQGQSRGWTDLCEQHEGHLVRACRRHLGESDAIVFVRRLLADLRSEARIEGGVAVTSLRAYRGVRPLRIWLCERAMARLAAARCWQQHGFRRVPAASSRLALVLQRVTDETADDPNVAYAGELPRELSSRAESGPISIITRA
jgi:hypothetical protein